VNRFIGSSLVITTIRSYTLKFTVAIAYVTSYTKSSNYFSDHLAVPLELRNSSEVNSHFRILSYLLGTDHAQKTLYCCVPQTTQKTNHVIAILPVYWHGDCCLATSYEYSFYCCVRVLRSTYRAVAWELVYMSQYKMEKKFSLNSYRDFRFLYTTSNIFSNLSESSAFISHLSLHCVEPSGVALFVALSKGIQWQLISFTLGSLSECLLPLSSQLCFPIWRCREGVPT
jgi:hypothetical protein